MLSRRTLLIPITPGRGGTQRIVLFPLVALSVIGSWHMAVPELRVHRPYHQPGADTALDAKRNYWR
jgi:hypothetical protein